MYLWPDSIFYEFGEKITEEEKKIFKEIRRYWDKRDKKGENVFSVKVSSPIEIEGKKIRRIKNPLLDTFRVSNLFDSNSDKKTFTDWISTCLNKAPPIFVKSTSIIIFILPIILSVPSTLFTQNFQNYPIKSSTELASYLTSSVRIQKELPLEFLKEIYHQTLPQIKLDIDRYPIACYVLNVSSEGKLYCVLVTSEGDKYVSFEIGDLISLKREKKLNNLKEIYKVLLTEKGELIFVPIDEYNKAIKRFVQQVYLSQFLNKPYTIKIEKDLELIISYEEGKINITFRREEGNIIKEIVLPELNIGTPISYGKFKIWIQIEQTTNLLKVIIFNEKDYLNYPFEKERRAEIPLEYVIEKSFSGYHLFGDWYIRPVYLPDPLASQFGPYFISIFNKKLEKQYLFSVSELFKSQRIELEGKEFQIQIERIGQELILKIFEVKGQNRIMAFNKLTTSSSAISKKILLTFCSILTLLSPYFGFSKGRCKEFSTQEISKQEIVDFSKKKISPEVLINLEINAQKDPTSLRQLLQLVPTLEQIIRSKPSNQKEEKLRKVALNLLFRLVKYSDNFAFKYETSPIIHAFERLSDTLVEFLEKGIIIEDPGRLPYSHLEWFAENGYTFAIDTLINIYKSTTKYSDLWYKSALALHNLLYNYPYEREKLVSLLTSNVSIQRQLISILSTKKEWKGAKEFIKQYPDFGYLVLYHLRENKDFLDDIRQDESIPIELRIYSLGLTCLLLDQNSAEINKIIERENWRSLAEKFFREGRAQKIQSILHEDLILTAEPKLQTYFLAFTLIMNPEPLIPKESKEIIALFRIAALFQLNAHIKGAYSVGVMGLNRIAYPYQAFWSFAHEAMHKLLYMKGFYQTLTNKNIAAMHEFLCDIYGFKSLRALIGDKKLFNDAVKRITTELRYKEHFTTWEKRCSDESIQDNHTPGRAVLTRIICNNPQGVDWDRLFEIAVKVLMQLKKEFYQNQPSYKTFIRFSSEVEKIYNEEMNLTSIYQDSTKHAIFIRIEGIKSSSSPVLSNKKSEFTLSESERKFLKKLLDEVIERIEELKVQIHRKIEAKDINLIDIFEKYKKLLKGIEEIDHKESDCEKVLRPLLKTTISHFLGNALTSLLGYIQFEKWEKAKEEMERLEEIIEGLKKLKEKRKLNTTTMGGIEYFELPLNATTSSTLSSKVNRDLIYKFTDFISSSGLNKASPISSSSLHKLLKFAKRLIYPSILITVFICIIMGSLINIVALFFFTFHFSLKPFAVLLSLHVFNIILHLILINKSEKKKKPRIKRKREGEENARKINKKRRKRKLNQN